MLTCLRGKRRSTEIRVRYRTVGECECLREQARTVNDMPDDKFLTADVLCSENLIKSEYRPD